MTASVAGLTGIDRKDDSASVEAVSFTFNVNER